MSCGSGGMEFEMNYTEKERVWSLLYTPGDDRTDELINRISEAAGVSDICARIMYNRGHRTPEDAVSFLKNDVSLLHDPRLMKDMDKAVDRILEAVRTGERITVYGDYDVDGVTSTSLLYLYLKSIGATVDYYIPSRKEGYGLSAKAIDGLSAKGTDLIVTVDTGITAYEEAKYAKMLGVGLVITDHHECRADLPEAYAVVNPHRLDCTYPFCELAGVGVAFKLACALEVALHPDKDEIEMAEHICEEYIDLVAIGTIADVMPLVDENRVIVSRGLSMISSTDRPGLQALIDAAASSGGNSKPAVPGVSREKKRKINAGYIGFGIAPRINAAGRISTAGKAVDLLLCESYEEAYPRAEELCEINLRRQIEENKIAEQAYKMIEQTHDFEKDKVIVLEDDGWQQGIIGIVSSRITEKYGLPSILISFDGATRGYASLDDMGKGSGRSIKGMNLVDALVYCEDLLVRYGGHELAAGLTVRRCNIDEFRKKINEYARERLTEEDTKVRLDADCELSLGDATMALATEISALEPFGIANPTPIFLVRDLKIDRIISMGSGKHTKLLLSDGTNTVHGVYFGMPASRLGYFVGDRVDLLCQLNINEFRNISTLQLIVQDVKLSQTYIDECRDADSRYLEVLGGADCPEYAVPEREDIIDVYRLLRQEGVLGHSCVDMRTLLSLLGAYSQRQINYIKLRAILDILNEMKVCDIRRDEDGRIEFEVFEKAEKTNVEASATYKRLKHIT